MVSSPPPVSGGPTPQRPRALGMEVPIGTDATSVRKRIEALEMLLERSLTIPVINRPVGLDAVAGLVPVAGDLLTAAMGLYIVWEGKNLGMPRWKLWRMLGNVVFDSAVGAVPVAGDLFDFLYRSNTRNLRIIKRHLDKHHPAQQVIDA